MEIPTIEDTNSTTKDVLEFFDRLFEREFKSIGELKEELANLRSRLDKKEMEIRRLKEENDKLKAQKIQTEKLKIEQENLEEQLSKLQSEKIQLEEKIRQLENELSNSFLEYDFPDLLLTSYFIKENQAFQNRIVFLVQHVLFEFPSIVSALLESGTKPDDIFVVGIPYSTKINIIRYIQERMKIQNIQDVYAPTTLEEFYNDIRHGLDKALRKAKSERKKIIIIEDGGDATRIFHEFFKKEYCSDSLIIGSVEQTTRGKWIIEDVQQKHGLCYPVISIPDSNLKRTFEPHFVGDAVVRNIENLLQYIGFSLRGRHVVVVGYGTIGSRVAEAFKQKGAWFSVVEKDPKKRIIAWINGFETFSDLAQVNRNPFIIVGCTGTTVVTKDVILQLNNTILVNASSKQVEIDVQFLEKAASKIESHLWGKLYKLGRNRSRNIYLLAEGYPVNFYSSDSIPASDIDVIIALMMKSALYLVLNAEGLKPGIYPSKEEIEDEIAKMYMSLLR